MQITHGSTQNILVNVRDTTGYLTTLVGASPEYNIYNVDDDDNETLVLAALEGTPVNMQVRCLVETLYHATNNLYPYGIANNVPGPTLLPRVVTAGVNDQFNFSNILVGNAKVTPGTYTTYDAIATAMNNALSQYGGGYSYYYGIEDTLQADFKWDGVLGKFRCDGTDYSAAQWNGLTINAGTHDFLAGTGWVSGQVVLDHGNLDLGVSHPRLVDIPLPVGKYHLYVSFTARGAEVPIVGPVVFFVI